MCFGWRGSVTRTCVRVVKVWRCRRSRQRVTDRWYQYSCDSSSATSRHWRRQTSSASYRQIVEEMFSSVVHRIQCRLLGGLHSVVTRSRRPQCSQLTTCDQSSPQYDSYVYEHCQPFCFYVLPNNASPLARLINLYLNFTTSVETSELCRDRIKLYYELIFFVHRNTVLPFRPTSFVHRHFSHRI